jgi:hypothetical protein
MSSPCVARRQVRSHISQIPLNLSRTAFAEVDSWAVEACRPTEHHDGERCDDMAPEEVKPDPVIRGHLHGRRIDQIGIGIRQNDLFAASTPRSGAAGAALGPDVSTLCCCSSTCQGSAR